MFLGTGIFSRCFTFSILEEYNLTTIYITELIEHQQRAATITEIGRAHV